MNPYKIYRVPDHLNKSGAIFAFEGQTTVEGKEVLLQVGLDENFPRSLPQIYIVPWDALGFLPHVDNCGMVCYAQKEGLLLNRYAPASIIKEAIERSLQTLAKGLREENLYDFVEEFEAYWGRLNDTKLIPAAIEPGKIVRKVTATVEAGQDDNMPICVSSDPGIMRSYVDLDVSKSYIDHTAIYLPFEEGFYLEPPHYHQHWELEWIQAITREGLSHTNYKRLQRLGNKCGREQTVVFSLPKPSGNSAMFGLHFVGVNKCSPLLPGGGADKWISFLLDRRDKAFLLPRGGANLQLRKKHVAILGCGSVGGFLAFELARAGIQNLTLVDPDILNPENTFRHVLGQSDWGNAKASALKKEIENKLPYTQVRALTQCGEAAIQQGDLKLREYDLIISAIGNDTTNLYINQLIHDEASAPPLIFTWLEPYGIGGHTLLTRRTHGSGCLQCLFTPTPNDHDYLFHNRAAFAAEGQFFGKTVSGCSDLFTPYGSSDAVRTATLASDLAINALLNQEPGNPLISWKGHAEEFLQAGFSLSRRHNMTEHQIFEQRYDYQVTQCPICGS
jgi:molybdopterin/thiamine biosynthesis adenylyltransferase